MSLVEIPVDKIEAVCLRHHISNLTLFGSAARDDFQPDSSDIDLLVEFKDGHTPSLFTFVSLKEELETIFQRKVDLVTASILHNPYRRKAIQKDMEQLYAA